jgi:hypothetical protein
VATIPNDDIFDISDPFAIYKHSANLDGLNLFRAGGGHFQNVTIFENETMVLWHSDSLREFAVSDKMSILPMDGYEVARPSKLEHGL